MSVECQCGEEAGTYVVKKSGPNLGRKFYGCHHSPKQCNFFKWMRVESHDPPPQTQVVPDEDPIVNSPPRERPRKMVKIMLVEQGITLEVPEERFMKILFH